MGLAYTSSHECGQTWELGAGSLRGAWPELSFPVVSVRSGDFPPRTVLEAAVAQVFGVAHGDLFKATRGRARVALARQVAMYLAHVACGLSFTEVGVLFARDRTTVAHACAVVEDRRDDPIFDRALDLLEWAVPSLLMPRHSRSMQSL
jgi:Bacterial dnaA protein helix-turn-helix